MTRNWDLLRWLLNESQSAGAGYPIVITQGATYSSPHYNLDLGDHNFEEVCEHALLLGDHGLAIVRDLGRNLNGPTGVAIDRLTMEGHDFLAAAADENRWKTAMVTVQEKGGTVTVGVLTQILAALLRQSFGL